MTWADRAPDSLDIFYDHYVVFYYSLGSTLERTWGTYRYKCVYFLRHVVHHYRKLSVHGICLPDHRRMAAEAASVLFYRGSMSFSTYYINLSIFLAFAATYPDMQVLLMFVIPVKVKWMGILDAFDGLLCDCRQPVYEICNCGILT